MSEATIPSQPSAADPAADASAEALAASERALNAARQAASKALAALSDLTQSVREQGAALAEKLRPQLDSAASYAKDRPVKTLLISAALGAAVVGLIALLSPPGRRAASSMKSSLGDAAADAYDTVRGGVADSVDSLRDKAAAASDLLREQAAAAGERLRQPIDSVAAYTQEDPTKALLIAAVAGAVAMALIAAVASAQRDD